MAEAIVDGIGSGNYAHVDIQNRIWSNVSGTVSALALTDEYIQRIDYSGTMNVPIYIGLAAPGTAVNVAEWQLKQLSYHTNSMVSGVLFGSGNTNFDKKWSDRDDANAEYS